MEPTEVFWSTHYLRHNKRRQEHLASLHLPVADRSVLEVGAGIGDHTSFFLDRGCTVVVTEPQEQNLAILRSRYPELDVRQVDLNTPAQETIAVDIVYCYGTLYHLERPAEAIAWMAACANQMILLETCVSGGAADAVYPFDENAGDPENAVTGHGCRPTRTWVRRELSTHFPYVYLPVTQPSHEEFPVDWARRDLSDEPLIRAVFVASTQPMVNHMLTDGLPMTQPREVDGAVSGSST
jgi:hypothetical protein